MSVRHKHSEEKMRLIYETALRLFREKGFDETRISDICREAGVPVGSVYHFFENKESFLEVYARQLGAQGKYILDNSTLQQDPLEVLREYYRYKVHTLEQAGIKMCRSLNERTNILWMSGGEYNENSGVYSLTPFLEKRMAAGQLSCVRSAGEMAWLMQVLFLGCVSFWLSVNGSTSLREITEQRFLPFIVENLEGRTR